jgi:beta-galactosidase
MKMEVTRAGLTRDGKPAALISGAMHYWRVARERWEPVLDRVAELGFRTVETYVPWSVHELERGRFDFGSERPERNLPEFIGLLAARGLSLIVRPGPHINAELTGFGFPRRVLADPSCQARTVDGDPVWIPLPPKMWPAPSYAAEAFFAEVELWFAAVAPIISPHLAANGGNIIALQIDNECCNFFRTSPYDHDYHPDALALWERFYAAQYGGPAPAPPREFRAESKSDLPAYLAWVAFKEHYQQSALRRFRSIWERLGITDTVLIHNYPVGGDMPPNDHTAAETIVDVQGPDMYPTRKQYWAEKSLVSYASGLSRLPYLPEFGSGSCFWLPPMSVRDQAFTTPAAFMHGAKAVNFYMLVERERWYGSPITRDGRKRTAQWEFFRDFQRWFARTRINELTKQASALLLSARDYERLAEATTILDPLPPLTPAILPAKLHASADKFGFAESIPMAYEQQWSALFHGLSAAKVPFDCGNTSQAGEALRRYRMVLCPTYEFMAAAAQTRLADYARAGGVLVIGPRWPELDYRMKPCAALREACDDAEIATHVARTFACGAGRVVLIPSLEKASARKRPEATTTLMLELARAFELARPYPAADPMIETVLHRDERGAVLFVANPTSEDRTAEIELDGQATLVDVRNEETFAGAKVSFAVAGHTVRIFELK